MLDPPNYRCVDSCEHCQHLDYDVSDETVVMGRYVLWTKYKCRKHDYMVFEGWICDDYEVGQ